MKVRCGRRFFFLRQMFFFSQIKGPSVCVCVDLFEKNYILLVLASFTNQSLRPFLLHIKYESSLHLLSPLIISGTLQSSSQMLAIPSDSQSYSLGLSKLFRNVSRLSLCLSYIRLFEVSILSRYIKLRGSYCMPMIRKIQNLFDHLDSTLSH